MWGNNEVGTLQPVAEIADVCAARGITLHCDAAQAVGKVPIDVSDIAISILTMSAHKFYGPKGVGALFVRDLNKRASIAPRVFGGGQERALRAGTPNVPGIVGMGATCSLARAHASEWCRHIRQLRDYFESKLFERLKDISLNGNRDYRLPHISNVAFHGTDNEGLLTMLPRLVASTGSACHVADFAPSHVLKSLGKAPDVTECSIRFGFGKGNTEHEVTTAVGLICTAVGRSRIDQHPICDQRIRPSR